MTLRTKRLPPPLIAAVALGLWLCAAPTAIASSPSPSESGGQSPAASSYEPGVVLVEFDHTLSTTDQERFELRFFVSMDSLDESTAVYRFRILDGIDASWKADSIRHGTEDGITWAGTTADRPPPRADSSWALLVAAAAGSLILVAILLGVFRWRRIGGATSRTSSSAKPSRARSDRQARRPASPGKS